MLRTPPDDPVALERAMRKARERITQAQVDEYAELLQSLSDDELAAELRTAQAAIDQEPHAAIAVGAIALEQHRRERHHRPVQVCTYCGKDERDDIGPIVNGACPGCTRAWS